MTHSFPAKSPVLRFDNVTFGYDRHPAVHHLDGVVQAGALVAVIGPNGAGKSTLLKGIVGVLSPLSGRILRDGFANVGQIAYLPQAAEIDRSFPINVYDFVAMGLWQKIGAFGGIGKAEQADIADAIGKVGLTGFERRAIETLSGGQMQRMLFARLILQDAQLIVLDEPFSAIDARACSDLLKIVTAWHDQGRTILAALHDMDMVRSSFPQTLLLAREKVAFGPTAEVLTENNLSKARRMCEAFDEEASECAA